VATILFGGFLTLSLPRKYPPQFRPEDWNIMCDFYNGFTLTGSFSVPYKYIVIYNPVTFVYNVCNAFQILYSHANPATAINWALNSLTVGRTWKEKVVLVGDFTIDASLLIPSYTIFELFGRIYLANNADKHILQNSDVVGGNTNIEVVGGFYDGNKANQPALDPVTAVFMCYFAKVTNLSIHNVTIKKLPLRRDSCTRWLK
jgi:hypothetical protein